MFQLLCNKSIVVTTQQLNLKNTLVNGQCFNWWKQEDQSYLGVVGSLLCILKENNENIEYRTMNTGPYEYYNKQWTANDLLIEYFNLGIDMNVLMQRWNEDAYFKSISKHLGGLRVVKQEPFECLISFMVSQNNNIKRITNNLLDIRKHGKQLGSINEQPYYQFPDCETLKVITEEQYKLMGLGYRARYLKQTVGKLNLFGGEDYLYKQIGDDPSQILKNLLYFPGVGRKVADCVRLYGFECTSIVPVDTHIFQIYQNHYSKSKSTKDTKIHHDAIQSEFAEYLGEYAGWAQSYLFTAELPDHKQVKQVKVVKDSKLKKQQKK